MNYEQREVVAETDRLPALLAFFVDTVFLQRVVRVCEHVHRCLKTDAMLLSVGFVFLFVPLESHLVIRAYNTDREMSS